MSVAFYRVAQCRGCQYRQRPRTVSREKSSDISILNIWHIAQDFGISPRILTYQVRLAYQPNFDILYTYQAGICTAFHCSTKPGVFSSGTRQKLICHRLNAKRLMVSARRCRRSGRGSGRARAVPSIPDTACDGNALCRAGCTRAGAPRTWVPTSSVHSSRWFCATLTSSVHSG